MFVMALMEPMPMYFKLLVNQNWGLAELIAPWEKGTIYMKIKQPSHWATAET